MEVTITTINNWKTLIVVCLWWMRRKDDFEMNRLSNCKSLRYPLSIPALLHCNSVVKLKWQQLESKREIVLDEI